MRILANFLLCVVLLTNQTYAYRGAGSNEPAPSGPPPSRNEMLDQVKDGLIGLQRKMIFDKNKPLPSESKEVVIEYLDLLYRAGFISLNQRNQFVDGFLNLPIENNNNIFQRQSNYEKYANFIVFRINLFKSNTPAKLNLKELSTAGAQCKDGLVSLPNMTFEQNNPGAVTKGGDCTKHEDCISKYCSGLESSAQGSCEGAYTCFKLVAYGEECGIEDPYCDQSEAQGNEQIICNSVNYNSSNVNECIPNNGPVSCNTPLDCCSGKCESNRCVPSFKCEICKEQGEEPSDNPERKCCPGLYEDYEGICRPDFPKFILPQANLIEKRLPKSKSIFKKYLMTLLDFVFSSAHAQDLSCENVDGSIECSSTISENYEEYQEAINNCMKMDNEETKRACLDQVSADYSDPENNPLDTESLSQDEYVNVFGIPAFTAKERSDVKNCKFNSFNDNWLDASATQQNAEIVLKGFEVILSGVGTQDKIYFEDDYSNKNIYQRLRDIMDTLRTNRIEMANSLAELDTRMACLCMEAFGVNTFDSNKQDTYRAECNATIESVDGDKQSSDAAKTKDTDMGATGITHEELLAKWLDERKTVQVDRFQNNEEVETQLEEFIEDFQNINWQEAELKENVLYKFEVKQLNGFWSAMAAIGVVLFTIAFGAYALVAEVVNFVVMGLVSLVTWEWQVQSVIVGFAKVVKTMWGDIWDDPEYRVYDERKSSRTTFWHKITKYERRIIWSRYQDSASQGCRIWGKRRQCISNFYFHQPDAKVQSDPEYGAFYQRYMYNPLIDIWVPNFYNSNVNNFNQLDMQIIEKTNDAYYAGVTALRQAAVDSNAIKSLNNLNPDGKKSKSWKADDPFTETVMAAFVPDLDFMKTDGPDGEPIVDDTYMWTQDRINAIKVAIAAYAHCEKLTECTEFTDSEGNTHTLTMTADQNKENLIGLHHFFPEVEDAELFADYVYQMHFFWPKLSSDTSYFYPPLGLDAYLELVLYNIKLVGSLNLMRSMGYADAYDAYADDLAKRKGYNQATSGDVQTGKISKNSKYSRTLFSAMKLVNFSTGQGVEDFNKAIASAKGSGNLTAADLSAAEGIKNHAMRLKEDQKQNAHFKKYAEKSPRGKRKLAAAQAFAKRFNSPLDMIKSMTPGTGVNPLTGKSEAKPKKNTAPKAPVISSYKAPSFKMSTSNYNPSSYNSQSNTSGDMPAHGLGHEEVTTMLERAKKDSSLRNINADDTIFSIVSKCYKRNLDRVLVSSRDIEKQNKSNVPVPKLEKKIKPDISDKKKNELKSLLGE